MGIVLGNPGYLALPPVPTNLHKDNPELYTFLEALRRNLSQSAQGLFHNDRLVVDAMNSGTSGTFTLSSGGSIIITSGVVIKVTS
jgi:hypothetical protein